MASQLNEANNRFNIVNVQFDESSYPKTIRQGGLYPEYLNLADRQFNYQVT